MESNLSIVLEQCVLDLFAHTRCTHVRMSVCANPSRVASLFKGRRSAAAMSDLCLSKSSFTNTGLEIEAELRK